MKTAKKTAIIVSVILIAIGMIISFCALVKIDFDFSNLSTVEYETKVYQVEKSFENIEINSDECNIRFVRSENKECKVAACTESSEASNTVVAVNGDTLTVKHTDRRKWYETIGINFETPEITVYLPKSEYESLDLQSLSGNIEVAEKFSFKNVIMQSDSGNIKMSYSDIQKDLSVKSLSGNIVLSGLNAKNISSESDSGNIKFSDVIALEKVDAESLSGDIRLNKCDAKMLRLKSDSGNITGTLLSEKIFAAHSDSGYINVPNSVPNSDEKCDISTLSGDIKIEINRK